MERDGANLATTSLRYSRRAMVSYSLAAAALLASRGRPARASAPIPDDSGVSRPWLLATPDELRPPEPVAPTSDEQAEVLRFQSQRTAATIATVEKWADGPTILPWTSLELDLIRVHRLSPAGAARALAFLHVALHDTVVAVRDAAEAHPRQAPWQVDSQVTLLAASGQPDAAFPSEHAAVAAAASTILAHLFPREPADGLAALAQEAAESRLWAGAVYRSDIEAGLGIGLAVAERAIARAKADGSGTAWDGSGRPATIDAWQPTPPGFVQSPTDPLAGTWQTWVIPGGDAYRPPAPPASGSAAWRAELQAVQDAVAHRTDEEAEVVLAWAGGPGTATPAGLWLEITRDLIVRDGLDGLEAAAVLALTSVAMADALICCWDAKYTYWTARPITADPTLDVLIPTPPFPSYTSGHATASTAAATVLGHFFLDDTSALLARAAEATRSRLWAGIHFPLDCEMGMVGGGMVGRLVVVRASVGGG